MTLDPQIRALLPALNAAPLAQASAAQARAVFHDATVATQRPIDPGAGVSATDVTVDGAEAPLLARIYRPATSPPWPTLVYFHGGGFVLGDIETHDRSCRSLCVDADVVLLSVEYRLAPEAPFPAAVLDALAATRWAAAHLDELGGAPQRLVVGGDSAGANLAAVAAQQLHDDGPPLAAQLLIYPATDLSEGEYPSFAENGSDFYLTLADMAWFNEQYVPRPEDRRDPRASPLLAADLTGLPPALVFTAEYDPLRDPGEAYAKALEAAGVPTLLRRYPGMIHGFFGLGDFSVAAAEAVADIGHELGRLLAELGVQA